MTIKDKALFSLLKGILGNQYPPESSLPPERDLARSLQVSRNTLREVLRVLSSWGLCRIRKGSGIRVRSFREEAHFDIVPSYISMGMPGSDPVVFFRQLIDLVACETAAVAELAAMKAAREGIDLRAARACFAEALRSCSRDVDRFNDSMYGITLEMCRASGNMPALWLLNSLGIFRENIMNQQFTRFVAEGFMGAHGWEKHVAAMLDAVERGDGRAAREHTHRHFEQVRQELSGLPFSAQEPAAPETGDQL